MADIKYPEYTYKEKNALLRNGTRPVVLNNARELTKDHHFVLAWDGKEEAEDVTVSLGILTSVQVTSDKTRYGVHTCAVGCDLTYDNAVYIHNERCPEVLVKSEAGTFVGRLIGVDYEKGMAVVQCNNVSAQYSVSIVTYVDDVNIDLLGIRKPSEGDNNG